MKFSQIQKKIHGMMKSAMRKILFLHKLDTYRKLKSDENRISMVKAKSGYKALLFKSRFDFDKANTNKFLSAKNIKRQIKLDFVERVIIC